MEPDLLVGIKDIMAISDVSIATAKRRHARFRQQRVPPDLIRYCGWYKEDYASAKKYLVEKRFDPLHCTRIQRKERLPYYFEIHTWEEPYYDWKKMEVRKLLFHQFILFDTDGKKVIGRMRYFTIPTEFIWFDHLFEVPLFERLIAQFGRVENRKELLYFFGLKAGKYREQHRLGLILDLEVEEDHELNLILALRDTFFNSKKVWFCAIDLIRKKHRKALSFREIKGTGFAIAALPGGRRFGRVDVWMVGDGGSS